MNIDEIYELQEKESKQNKESYKIIDGKKYINIVESQYIGYNASSICETLSDDLKEIDNRISYLSFSKFSSMLVRIINKYGVDCDKKIKDWIIRNYKNHSCTVENNRELNKMIRNNYVFYYDNKHNVLYR